MLARPGKSEAGVEATYYEAETEAEARDVALEVFLKTRCAI